nr:4836_t:CDS:2 [Entrophospora candida]
MSPNRRMAHILSEKKRRNNINSGFLELKGIVPNCRDSGDSKASILKKASIPKSPS